MDSLDVVWVVVPPCSANTFGMDVVGNNVGVLGELLLAQSADALLGDNILVEELPHFAIGAEFPVSPGMLQVLYATDAHLAPAPFSWNGLSSAAEQRTVDRTELIPAESHARSPDWLWWKCAIGEELKTLRRYAIYFIMNDI